MKNFTLKSLVLLLTCSFAITFNLQAQELIYEVPLSNQVQSSSQIIEGRVISKQSIWDEGNLNIYTINTVEVYKVFKGQTILSTVEIITPGGTVGLHAEIVTPSLQLSIGDTGIFMLKDNAININLGQSGNRYQPYSSSQGFYKYNLFANTAANPIRGTFGISDMLYNSITSLTNTEVTIVNEQFDTELIYNQSIANRGSISITNFTPTSVTGGTDTTITINGSGFGVVQGTVGFRDANFGGEIESPANSGNYVPFYYEALDTEVISWSDTQIVVEVPSRAGTGDIEVTPNGGGTSATSSQTLTVLYSEINVTYDPGTGFESYETRHIDRNSNGGYVWQMYTGFDANTPAKESFIRAFDTWRCETDVYWEIGATTTTNVIADDDINIIRFDVGSELPTGILGRCTSRFSGCGGATINWFVEELDIVFEDNFTGGLSVLSWEYGPDTATGFEVDFESVALHELGHGHQLAHVINSGQVMHYSLVNGQNSRILSSDDISGGNSVHARSTGSSICGQGTMSNFDCATLSLNENEFANTLFIYPNPTKDVLHIKHSSNISLEKAILYDVRGRLISEFNLGNSTSINTSQLHSGVYFIQIDDTNNNTLTKKIIVE